MSGRPHAKTATVPERITSGHSYNASCKGWTRISSHQLHAAVARSRSSSYCFSGPALGPADELRVSYPVMS
jgi:hypothetical protein